MRRKIVFFLSLFLPIMVLSSCSGNTNIFQGRGGFHYEGSGDYSKFAEMIKDVALKEIGEDGIYEYMIQYANGNTDSMEFDISSSGTWKVNGIDTGVAVTGSSCTPAIGANGNCYINGKDTGIPMIAAALIGGGAAASGAVIGSNGNYYVNGEDTGVKPGDTTYDKSTSTSEGSEEIRVLLDANGGLVYGNTQITYVINPKDESAKFPNPTGTDVFLGWFSGDTVVTAKSAVNGMTLTARYYSYNVSFMNYDGSPFDVSLAFDGHEISSYYPTTNPTKPNDGTKTYTFVRWDIADATKVHSPLVIQPVFEES